MKKLDYEEMGRLELLNPFLYKCTKIDFMKQMEECALRDSCTELEAKSFLRKNYPGADKPENLKEDDRKLLSFLLRYYFQVRKAHDSFKKEHEAVKIAVPKNRPNLSFYDSMPSGCFKTAYTFC